MANINHSSEQLSEKETAVFMGAASLYVLIAACVFMAIGFSVVLKTI